jgi:hypothetical protein
MEAEIQQVAGMSPEQMEAAWSAVRSRHQAMHERIATPEASPASPAREEGNPKDIASTQRLPLDLWPHSATAMACIALLNGSLKYGRANWRYMPVKASVYVGAAQRHLAAWFDGEDADEEGVPHLSSVLASMAIVVDAMAAETLIDDRPTPGGYRRLATELTPHVGRLRALHAAKAGSA